MSGACVRCTNLFGKRVEENHLKYLSIDEKKVQNGDFQDAYMLCLHNPIHIYKFFLTMYYYPSNTRRTVGMLVITYPQQIL
jgi:hypothetical protein